MWRITALLCVVFPSAALAHEGVDEALALYQQAEFEPALARLDYAVDTEDLSADDLAQLLELRALINFALGESDAVDESLRALAAFRPRHDFSQLTPPALIRQFSQLRDRVPPISLALRRTAEGLETQISAGAEHVRSVALHQRPPGGEWQSQRGDAPRVPLSPEVSVEAYAEAIGLGGAVVARDGSADDPRVFLIEPEEDPSGLGIGAKVGIGGAAVALVAVVLAVLLSGGDTQLQPSAPVLEVR